MSCKSFPYPQRRHHGIPTPAVGHMPFPGHRTQESIRKQEEGARHHRKAIEYGFDPESLEVKRA